MSRPNAWQVFGQGSDGPRFKVDYPQCEDSAKQDAERRTSQSGCGFRYWAEKVEK